ncbi:MAG: hypothetical protein CSA33_01890 [Desulfobulbus propionicus]|nr:MAG: hypothetical protein CSA33_01890 [Desulfobulbus propionicus]
MSLLSAEEIVDTFLDHIRYLQIAHHVPGRIRVKARWNALPKLAAVDMDELQRVIHLVPGIYEYRINKKALSVVIEYNTTTLPYTLWEDVGTLAENPLNKERVRQQLLALLGGDEQES